MAQQHDIILNLDTKAFEKAITDAQAMLYEFEGIVQFLTKQIQNAFDRINLSGLSGQIQNVGNSFQKAVTNIQNASATGPEKLKEKLQETSDEAEDAAKTINDIIKKAKELGASLNDLSDKEIKKVVEALEKAKIQEFTRKTKELGTGITKEQLENLPKGTKQDEFNKKLEETKLLLKSIGVDLTKLSNTDLSKITSKLDVERLNKLFKEIKSLTPEAQELKAKLDALDKAKTDALNKSIQTTRDQLKKMGIDASQVDDKIIHLLGQRLDRKVINNQVAALEKQLLGLGKTATGTSQIFDQAVTSFGVALGHIAGNVAAGGNIVTAFLHEVPRNLALGFTRLGFKQVSDEIKAFGRSTSEAGAQAKKSSEDIKLLGDAVDEVQASAAGGGAGGFFTNLKAAFKEFNFFIPIVSIGLIALGKLLDEIGDKLLKFANDLAKTAGEANLAFKQLEGVLNATSESFNTNLGSGEKWLEFIRELAIQSGRSRKELADFAVSFIQVGTDAGLSGEEIQRLVKVAAFTGDRFRNATEQLTNFRQALQGNTRFLANNIPIGQNLAEVTDRYVAALVRQGQTQEQAAKTAKSVSDASKVLAQLEEASAPIIKIAAEETGSYTLELRKLQGAVENVKIAFGTAIEAIFARLTRTLRGVITLLASLPKPIQDTIGTLIALSAITVDIAGKFLKLVGILGLATAAVAAFNAVLTVTIPLLGTSLAGALTKVLGQFVMLPGELNTISKIFSALLATVSRFITSAGGLSGIFRAILASLTPLISILGSFLGSMLSLSVLFTAGKFLAGVGVIVALFKVFADAITKVANETGVSTIALEIFNTVLGTSITSLKELIESLHLYQRTSEGFSLATNLIASGLRLVAYLAGLAAIGILEYSSAQNKAISEQARNRGNISLAVDLAEKADRQAKAAERVSKALDLVEKAQARANAEMKQSLSVIFGTQQAIEALNREAVDATATLNEFGNAMQRLSEEQTKVLERAIKSLQQELDSLRVKNIELLKGKAAAEQEKALLRLKQLVKDINAEKGIRLFDNDNVRIDAIKSVKEIFDEIKKRAPAQAAELERIFNQIPAVAKTNEVLAEQDKLFKSIITSAKNLRETLSKQSQSLQESADIEVEFANAIRATSDNFERDLRNAERKKAVQAEILKIEKQISELQIQLFESKTDEGIPIKLRLEQEAEIQKRIADLRKQKILIGIRFDTEGAFKDFNKELEAILKKINDLSKKFGEDNILSQQQVDLLTQFNKDLDISVDFAERRRKIKERELEIDNQIRQIQREIKQGEDNKTLFGANLNKANADLKKLQESKARNNALDLENAKQILDFNNKIKQSIKEIGVELEDQVKLIEARQELFKEGIITGDFNEAKELIDALTSSLQSYIKERIRLERLSQDTNLGIDPKRVQEVTEEIDKLKAAIKALRFIEFVQELFTSVTDAIENAITEGVRGVIQGTQTIKELFRKMAQDILLSLSNITMKKALELLKAEINSFVLSLADSEIFKSIAKFFGIDLNDIKKILGAKLSPQEQLKLSTEENTIAQDNNTLALDRNTEALKQCNNSPPTGQQTTPNGQPSDTANLPNPDFSSSEIFDQFSEDFVAGFESMQQTITDFSSSEIFDQFSEDFVAGFESTVETVTPQVTSILDNFILEFKNIFSEGLTNVFTTIKTVISKGIKSLLDIFNFDNMFKKITDIFSSKSDSLTDTVSNELNDAFEDTSLDFSFEDFSSLFSDGFENIDSFFREVSLSFSEGFDSLLELSDFDITNLFDGISEIVENGITELNDVFNFGLDSLFNLADNGFTDIFDDITTSIEDGLTNIQEVSNLKFDSLFNLESTEFSNLIEDISSNLESGLEEISSIAETGFDSLFNEMGPLLSDGLDSLLDTGMQGFGSLFDNLSDTLISGFEGLTDLFSGAGEGISSILGMVSDIFGSIAFAAAKGGIVPGRPSKKDNRLAAVATGEGIINSDAVSYYGGKGFIDALNAMALPTDFFENLNNNAAPASIADARPNYMIKSAPNQQIQAQEAPKFLVQVINQAPLLDPKKLGLQEKDITRVVVTQLDKGGPIQNATRNDTRRIKR